MGIPSFYRHLLRKYPRLVTRGVGPAPEYLCLDFNCAMYGVLHKMPPVANPVVWERDFCRAIADYMGELITLARPTRGVYVSCDGVVCAAKRRQQRLRRFKGPWLAAQEAAVRRAAGGAESTGGTGWDQNALTPGSAFMAQLGAVLTAEGVRLGARMGLDVRVSTTAEPGEGEHKLLRFMREIRPTTCTIYGLDADLILLAMLLGEETGADVRLMREAQEFEKTGGAEEWRSLTVRGLVDVMIPPGGVRDYVTCMSLLGNDFLPRSLTRTVRADGIPQLLATLKSEVWSRGGAVVGADGALQREWLLAVVRAWAETEEADMLAICRDAAKVAGRRAGVGDSPEETALREWNAQPAGWAAVTRLLGPDGRSLRSDWRNIYRDEWGAGRSGAEYCRGVAWVWDYYSGRAVDQGWFYEQHLPPLWLDVAAALSESAVVASPTIRWPEPLPEWLHLLAVLPAESVERLLPPERQAHMARAPWYWPTRWSLFDVGRTQMWECEPVIPVIPESVLRRWRKFDE